MVFRSVREAIALEYFCCRKKNKLTDNATITQFSTHPRQSY